MGIVYSKQKPLPFSSPASFRGENSGLDRLIAEIVAGLKEQLSCR